MSTKQLLNILADGAFHSGEEIGIKLGVSRTAIWKKLNKIKELGIEVESIKGKGYRIEPVDLLCMTDILAGLSIQSRSLLKDQTIFELVTESTNDLVKERLASQGVNHVLCLAEHQTAGRGRRGRKWISPFARSIYLSLGWRFATGVAGLEGLSLAVAVGLIRTMKALGLVDAKVKWPNDILYQQAKMAGILIEMQGDLDQDCQVVIGVGLNISPPASIGIEAARAVIGLQEALQSEGCQPVCRNQVASILINELVQLVQHYERSGFQQFKSEWEQSNAFEGQLVDLHIGKQVIRGKVVGIDLQGGIQLEAAGEVTVYHGGEISLLRAEL